MTNYYDTPQRINLQLTVSNYKKLVLWMGQHGLNLQHSINIDDALVVTITGKVEIVLSESNLAKIEKTLRANAGAQRLDISQSLSRKAIEEVLNNLLEKLPDSNHAKDSYVEPVPIDTSLRRQNSSQRTKSNYNVDFYAESGTFNSPSRRQTSSRLTSERAMSPRTFHSNKFLSLDKNAIFIGILFLIGVIIAVIYILSI
jgi:hypothetical protein